MKTRAAVVRTADMATPTPMSCPLTAAVTAIGGKWNLICLFWLYSAPRRFSELHDHMPDISRKVLTETLRDLETEGLITRTVYAEVPSRVEYCISSHGESVRSLVDAVKKWGREHITWKAQVRSNG